MIRRILLGLTGTSYTPVAIRRATELAVRHGAAVTGITVSDRQAAANVAPLSMVSMAEAKEKRAERLGLLESRVSAAIEQFETAFAGSGIKTDLIRAKGDPVEALCQHWRYHDALIIGLRGLFDYGVLDEPDSALMKLIGSGVRPIIAVNEEYRPIERVLIAYSGSLASAKAMKRFSQLRLWPDATVRIAHFGDSTSETSPMLADAQSYCRDWGIEADTDHVLGSARTNLLPYATRWSADLVVMANSARSVLARRIFGSTTYTMIRESNIPLFLAH